MSLIFPKFLVEIIIDDPYRVVGLFDIGSNAYLFIIGNIILFSIIILVKIKNKTPILNNFFNRILNKDISKNTALLFMIILFVIYFIFSVDEFSREEFELGDYYNVKEVASDYSFEGGLSGNIVRYTLLNVSDTVLGNIKILPFVASISLLLITYFLTLELTKKRIAGIIAFTVLLQSNLFLLFDTTSTYENFWTAFYFFSLYLILKKPIGSPGSFIFALLSKGLVVTLIPINWYLILTSKISNNNKKYLLISYGILTIFILLIMFTTDFVLQTVGFNFDKFISGFNELGQALRFDHIILLLFFPATILLALKIGKNKNNTNIVLIGLIFSMISQPILSAILGITIQPYRYIPFIVFSSIAIGMIFMNSKTSD